MCHRHHERDPSRFALGIGRELKKWDLNWSRTKSLYFRNYFMKIISKLLVNLATKRKTPQTTWGFQRFFTVSNAWNDEKVKERGGGEKANPQSKLESLNFKPVSGIINSQKEEVKRTCLATIFIPVATTDGHVLFECTICVSSWLQFGCSPLIRFVPQGLAMYECWKSPFPDLIWKLEDKQASLLNNSRGKLTD